MSRVAQQSAKALETLETVESALERTQIALRAAESADLLAGAVAKNSRPILKVLLVLTVVGVAILVIKKLKSSSSTPPANTDPYGTDSTEK